MVFLICTPIHSRKKRTGFFIVVSTLVATKWLLMLGNRRVAAVLYYYPKNPHLIRPLIRSRKKRNGFFIVVSTLVATWWLLMLGKFETLGSNFSHETAGLLASFATIKKSISRPLQGKKAKLCLTFQLPFSKLLFSFFENNVFT